LRNEGAPESDIVDYALSNATRIRSPFSFRLKDPRDLLLYPATTVVRPQTRSYLVYNLLIEVDGPLFVKGNNRLPCAATGRSAADITVNPR